MAEREMSVEDAKRHPETGGETWGSLKLYGS